MASALFFVPAALLFILALVQLAQAPTEGNGPLGVLALCLAFLSVGLGMLARDVRALRDEEQEP